MEENFDVAAVKLRPPLSSDFHTLFRYACELEWFTCPSVIKTWINPRFTDGFCVAEYQTKPVGCIMAYNFNSNDTFVGYYVVEEKLRGKGIGNLLWQWMLSRTSGRKLWLTTAPWNEPMYQRRGLTRLQGRASYRKACRVPLRTSAIHLPGLVLRRYTADCLAAVARFDATLSGYDRSDMLAIWLAKENDRDDCPIYIAEQNGSVTGYGGLLKHSHNLYKVAPLYADNPDIARAILHELVTSVSPEAKFVADINHADHMREFLDGVLPEEVVLDELGESRLVVSEGAGIDNMDSSKLYFYTQVDTVPI